MFSSTRFNEVLKHLPRRNIQKIIRSQKGDHYRKSFSTWQHLITMILAQITECKSLRDIELTLSQQKNCLYHLGLSKVKKSTLSDANKTRKASIFKEIAELLVTQLSKQKRQLVDLVTALDSTAIYIGGRGSDWSAGVRKSSRGLKIHIQHDKTNDQIDYIELSDGTVNDITVAQTLALEKGRIYVFDKGYADYNWWNKIQKTGATFVTRLKKNSLYKVLEERPLHSDETYILKDQIICLTNRSARGRSINDLAGKRLRLLHVKHPDANRKDALIIVSNDCDSDANVVAGWYKDRWSVELIFKWLKQNLKLKKFIGESRNATMIQIYTAIICYVLMKLAAKQMGFESLRLKDIVVILKNCLFNRVVQEEAIFKRRRLSAQKQVSLFNFNHFVRAA